mgnify:CR=1 FL=1
MAIPLPSGVLPIRSLTTDEVLYGDRLTSYRWEVLEHADGEDRLVGQLDGVVDGSASLKWSVNEAVKGSGGLKVTDVDEPEPGLFAVNQLELPKVRLRPVLAIDGLPEVPFGVFLVAAAPEEWSATGRLLSLELLDRSTVLDQDAVDESYTVGTSTPILSAVKSVIESAGEAITIDASVTTTLRDPMVWPAGTTKLQIVNDLLSALNYSSLWVDGVGKFRATPYVLPARRSLGYELLNGAERKLVDGEESIYEQEWSRDLDMYRVPNKVIAVASGSGDAAPSIGIATNEDPESPFSYQSRGNRWIVPDSGPLTVDVPDFSSAGDPVAATVAFLENAALRSLIARSSIQASVSVKHLPVPLRVSDVVRFQNTPAQINARHTVTQIDLEAHPLGLMKTTLQEVVDL